MPILNYTTTISVEKTAGEIQRTLVRGKAAAVLTEYDDEGVLIALSFRLPVNDQTISFRLPARLDNIYIILQRDGKVPRKLKTRQQAARVAWRIIKDWVEAQLALVESGQVDMVEVFLPYAQHPATGQTVYQAMLNNGMKALIHDPAGEQQ